MLGHVGATAMKNVHPKKQMLLAIRDLRHVIVSNLRFVRKRSGHESAQSALKPEDLIAFMESAHPANTFAFTMAQEAVDLLNDAQVVRFEELVSDDPEQRSRSVQSFVAVTECSTEEVSQAIERAIGQETMTYSGQQTELLPSLWTKEVEDCFVCKDGYVLNKRLGY